jgi:hypothetical protein
MWSGLQPSSKKAHKETRTLEDGASSYYRYASLQQAISHTITLYLTSTAFPPARPSANWVLTAMASLLSRTLCSSLEGIQIHKLVFHDAVHGFYKIVLELDKVTCTDDNSPIFHTQRDHLS